MINKQDQECIDILNSHRNECIKVDGGSWIQNEMMKETIKPHKPSILSKLIKALKRRGTKVEICDPKTFNTNKKL